MVNDVTGLRVAAVSSTHDAIDAVRAFPVATRPEARGPICNWPETQGDRRMTWGRITREGGPMRLG
jgi:hypothetical protein